MGPSQIAADGTWAMPPGEGPCRTWPIPAQGCGCLPEDPAAWDEVQRHAVEVATELLWRLTAGRFGLCWELVRPCPAPCLPPNPATGRPRGPAPVGGEWVDMSMCGCSTSARRGCSCGTPPSMVALPGPLHYDPDIHPVTVWVDEE